MALHGLHYGPNMTPMVDVVLVILIFFMASAAILGPEWLLKTALPTRKPGASAAASKTTAVHVNLSGIEGSIAVSVRVVRPEGAPEERAGTLESLAGEIVGLVKELGAAGLAVTITADDRVPYDAVVRVHEACQKAGITRVGIADRGS